MTSSDSHPDRTFRHRQTAHTPRPPSGRSNALDVDDLWEEVSRELEKLGAGDLLAPGDRPQAAAVEPPAPAPEAEPDDPAPQHPVPADLLDRVTDEVVLALLHSGRVYADQVAAALDHEDAGTPLWRRLLQTEGVDRAAVFETVAKIEQHRRASLVDGEGSTNLYDSLRASHSAYWMEAVVARGAVPVASEIDKETGRLRVTFATADPSNPELKPALAGLGVLADVRYAPVAVVDPVRRRLIGTLPEAPSAPAGDTPPSDEAAVDAPTADGPDGEAAAAASGAAPFDVPSPDAEPEPPPKPVEAAAPAPPTMVREEARPGLDPARLDPRARRDRVVVNLARKGVVSEAQVSDALARHERTDGTDALWRVLAGMDGMDREAVYAESARVYAFRHEELGPGRPDIEFAMLILETMTREHREEMLRLNLVPFEYDLDPESGGPSLSFVTHDPARAEVHRLLGQLNMGRFELRYAPEKAVAQVIQQLKPRRNEFLDRMAEGTRAYDLGAAFEAKASLVDEDALEAEISRSTLINLFEASLVEAVRVGASDIHVFPNPRRQVEIHFRIDGRLRLWRREDKVPPESYLAVVKDNAMNVDRFERDQAQDGFIQRNVDGALIRFRVSVLPIASANQELRAESIVIRVLDDRKVITDLGQLGMLEGARQRLEQAIRQPHGMVILTGPTGSGKSTTLVAALHEVIDPEVNTLSIEDPVEYIIEGVRQIKLNHKLDLEAALRAVLRHDPDIVMVGEIRDKATADLAIKLANTGHLTFSTLHTNDAPAAVSRLFKMGVEPFLIAYAINLVVAQRLIRELCPSCKAPDDRRDPVLMKRLGFTEEQILSAPIYRANPGTHCHRCEGRGYRGRRAISETLHFSTPIRHLIAESGEEIDEEAIRRIARSEGMLSLQESARELVLQGATSVEEMMRVTATE